MGEYNEVAGALLNRINDLSARLLAKDVQKVVNQTVGGAGQVNCYPGTPGGGCFDTAYFISLNDSKRHGRGHLKFDKPLQAFVDHMDQDNCKGTTRVAIIITDTWDAKIVRDLQPKINRVKQDAHVEVYLLSGSNVIEIPI